MMVEATGAEVDGMEQGEGAEPRRRRWALRLERWLGRAAEANGGDAAPNRPAGTVTEARSPMDAPDAIPADVQERSPMTHGLRRGKRACAQCGRLLRWSLPLCWDCNAAHKGAGR